MYGQDKFSGVLCCQLEHSNLEEISNELSIELHLN